MYRTFKILFLGMLFSFSNAHAGTSEIKSYMKDGEYKFIGDHKFCGEISIWNYYYQAGNYDHIILFLGPLSDLKGPRFQLYSASPYYQFPADYYQIQNKALKIKFDMEYSRSVGFVTLEKDNAGLKRIKGEVTNYAFEDGPFIYKFDCRRP